MSLVLAVGVVIVAVVVTVNAVIAIENEERLQSYFDDNPGELSLATLNEDAVRSVVLHTYAR